MSFPVQREELATLQFLIANYFPGKDAAQAQAVLSRLAATSTSEAQGVPDDLREFAQRVAGQTPEKPDYWSSCGQCARNISDAEDLLASAPPAPQADRTHVLVPLRMTRAMREVVGEEDWSWADLLAAAEAVTEDEHAISEQSEPVAPQASVVQQQPLSDEQRKAVVSTANATLEHGAPMSWEQALIDAVEAAHGIQGSYHANLPRTTQR